MTAGFTLVEMLVVIALMSALTVIAVSTLPRVNHAPTNAALPARITSLLEAAHTQALSERVPLSVKASGDTLTITDPSGAEPTPFTSSQLTGEIDIQPDGTTSGQLHLTAPGLPACVSFTLQDAGQVSQGAC